MAILPEVDFQISNIDPICINFKVTLEQNDATLLDNVVIDISALNKGYLTFPRQGTDLFTFTNGDVITLIIQQGVALNPNDIPVYGPSVTIIQTIDIAIPSDPPAIPNVVSNIRLGPIPIAFNPNPRAIYPYIETVLSELDTADTVNYFYSVTRNGIVYQLTTTNNFSDSGVLPLISNTIIIDSICFGKLNNSDTFPTNRFIINDIVNLQIKTGIQLQPNIPNSTNVLWGITQSFTITIQNPVPPTPNTPTFNPSVSYYIEGEARRTKLNLLLNPLNPLCTQLKVSISWNGSPLITNLLLDNPGNGILSFPDLNGNNDLYPLMGNINIPNMAPFIIEVSQGIQYSTSTPNINTIVFSNNYEFNGNLIVSGLPIQPDSPTLSAITRPNPDKSLYFILTIDGIESISTDYYAAIKILRNGIPLTDVKGIPITFANFSLRGKIPSKPFNLTSINFGNIILQVDDEVTFNVTNSYNLDPNNPNSIDYYISDLATLSYTITAPIPLTPAQLVVTAITSLYMS